jgi:hypothetical protein
MRWSLDVQINHLDARKHFTTIKLIIIFKTYAMLGNSVQTNVQNQKSTFHQKSLNTLKNARRNAFHAPNASK